MKSLEDMAQEYLENVAVIEQRIAELQVQERHTVSCEERLRLRRRIQKLYTMAGEGRQLAFEMQHYYDKPEEGGTAYVKQPHTTKKPKRKKFSRSGYGAPTPALAVHGRNAHAAPISGLRAQLSRGNAAGRNRA